MAKLASLVVDLQLQSAQLRAGLNEANRKLDEFAKQAESTGNILAGALSFDVLKDAGFKLAEFVKSGADAADSMGDLAASVGVPVEALSKLSYAATFSGSSTEAVGKALSKTADLMSKALAPTSEQAALFKALGVSVTDADGRLRATEDVFADVAQRFTETSDGSAKTALAVRLFGDEGTKLIPLLNNGKAGLAAFGAEAERTGNVITEQGAGAAGDFNDALDRLHKAAQGLALRVAQDLAPNLVALAESFTGGEGSAAALNTAATALSGTLRVLASAGVMIGATFETVGQLLAGVASAAVNAAQGDFRAARDSLEAEGKALLTTWKDEGTRLKSIWETSGPGATMVKDAEKAKPSADAYVSAIDRTKAAAEKAAEAQKKLAEAAKKAAEEAGKALDEHVKSALALERQQAAIDRAAEKRRNDVSGAEATAGFADVEDAIARMAAAQKAAATMRSRADERSKSGDIIGADSATRKADQLDALAERAGAAADVFRDMAKTAEEKAGQFLEAQAAAAMALERQGEAIDRDVAKRREAASNTGRSPTDGFDGFNAALDATAQALKAEAAMRSEAGLLEKEGKLGEAHQAELAADAQKALAERASEAADAFAALNDAAARVPGELLGMLKPSGAATSAMLQGAETGAAAGPVGAVVGGLTGLLSQSETFQFALDQLETIFQALADSVGVLIEPILPLLDVFGSIASGFGALLEALSPLVEFIARPLFEMFRGFGLVVLNLVKFVGDLINEIAQLFGGEGFDMSGVNKALAKLESTTYDSARANEKAAMKTRELTESVGNVPSWWKVNLARFNAANDVSVGVSGGSTTTVNDNSTTTIVVNRVDNSQLTPEELDSYLEKKKRRRSNTKFDREIP